MPKAVKARKPDTYVLKCDRSLPEDQQTVFSYAPLTVRGRYEIEDLQVSTEQGTSFSFNKGRQEYETLVRGLKGWKNFTTDEGNQIPFDPKDMEKNLAFLKEDWCEELAGVIRGDAEKTDVD